MHYGFTEEQEFFRDAVRKLLDERAPIPRVREVAASSEGFDRDLWHEMASLGWLGLLIPEAQGGAGLGWVDALVLLEETGRSLLPSPLVSTALVATAVREAGDAAQQERWLPGFADGSRIGTLALLEDADVPGPDGIRLAAAIDGDDHVLHGEKRFVMDAAAADRFVVAYRVERRLVLGMVEAGAAGLAVESVPPLDATKRSGRLRLDGVRIAPADRLEGAGGADGSDAEATLDFLEDCGAVAVTAEALGAAERALAITVQYAKDRVQFGSPIGRFQGVKHRLAEMWVDLESVKSLLYYAAWTIENDRAALPRYASLAKAYVADAFTRIGVDCVQLHGAVGYTLEYDVQLYLKRSKWVRPRFGDADWHRDRLATRRSL